MRPDKPSRAARRAVPLHVRLYQAGAAILAVGLCAAVTIYLTAGDDASGESMLDLANNKRNVLDLERIGGQAAVLAVQFDQWFASLWHGKTLAFTLALLSALAAALCFWLGDELSPAAPDDRPPRDG